MIRSYICQVERQRESEGRPPGPLEHVLGVVRQSEPITAQRLSKTLRLPLDIVESAIADLEARGVVKRWTDNTVSGDSRTFVGTVNQHGLPEPMPGENLDAAHNVDARTVLSLVRQVGVDSVKQLIRRWPMPVDGLFTVAAELEKQGHIKITRRNGVVRFWANDPGWNWN